MLNLFSKEPKVKYLAYDNLPIGLLGGVIVDNAEDWLVFFKKPILNKYKTEKDQVKILVDLYYEFIYGFLFVVDRISFEILPLPIRDKLMDRLAFEIYDAAEKLKGDPFIIGKELFFLNLNKAYSDYSKNNSILPKPGHEFSGDEMVPKLLKKTFKISGLPLRSKEYFKAYLDLSAQIISFDFSQAVKEAVKEL